MRAGNTQGEPVPAPGGRRETRVPEQPTSALSLCPSGVPGSRATSLSALPLQWVMHVTQSLTWLCSSTPAEQGTYGEELCECFCCLVLMPTCLPSWPMSPQGSKCLGCNESPH